MQMIPSFYQSHLKSQLSVAEYLLLNILVNVIQLIKEVNLESIANALPIPILLKVDGGKSKDYYHRQNSRYPKFGCL
ncbi:MAG: hypothetical protein N5P05_002249 [Chroococcopsis gigantea SAG 12.99]|nr:hypothetical protein [Chroococcopsis gigantea SAG 12.99]